MLYALNAAQRPKLRHAGPTSVNREAELEPPSRVACSDLLGVMVLLLSHANTPHGICRTSRTDTIVTVWVKSIVPQEAAIQS